MPFITTAIFIVSSLISFGLIYFKLSAAFSQQIVSVTLLFSVVFLGKFNNVKKQSTPWQTSLAVLLSSFLVQMLVISSGGLYSPLLIIIHLYTLGAIFLLNSKTPIYFLFFSLLVLIGQIRYDPILSATFFNDPWTAVIYGMSFLIIIPLALYLSHNYFMKDAFTNLLKNYIQMQERKADSILTALNDLVVVTNQKLEILSVNISVEKYLQQDKDDILGKNLFDIFTFKDISGLPGTTSSLSIDAAMLDKASHFVDGFMLETVGNIKPKPVLIQVRPLTDEAGKISQIVFVMSEPGIQPNVPIHQSLAEALKRKNSLLDSFAAIRSATSYESIKAKIGLVTHIEEDIYLNAELEDHSPNEKPILADMVVLSSRIIEQNRPLSEFLATNILLNYEDPEAKEAAFIKLHESKTSDADLAPSIYSLPVEEKFIGVIIGRPDKTRLASHPAYIRVHQHFCTVFNNFSKF